MKTLFTFIKTLFVLVIIFYAVSAFLVWEINPSNWELNKRVTSNYVNDELEIVQDYFPSRVILLIFIATSVIVAVLNNSNPKDKRKRIVATNSLGNEYSAIIISEHPRLISLANKVFVLNSDNSFDESNHIDLKLKICQE